jgi:hypothetical protein
MTGTKPGQVHPMMYTDPRGEFVPVAVLGGVAIGLAARWAAKWIARKLTSEVVGAAANAVYSEITREQEKERGAERRAYKTYCNNPPPPTGDACMDIMNRINHAQQCIALRESFSGKWYGGTDASHQSQLQELRNRIARLEGELAVSCPHLCLLNSQNNGTMP